MNAIRVPPGRSGRQWVRHRLDSAEHAAGLLERKLRALREEQHRLAEEAERTRHELATRAEEARTWTLRAALSGGRRGVRLACTGAETDVTISWATTVGVHHPAGVEFAVPADAASLPGGTAIARAADEQRRTLEAALRHAVVSAALRRITADTDATRRRVRVLRQHWVPRLREALVRVEAELEERERAESVRHRIASDHGTVRFGTFCSDGVESPR